MSTPLSGSPTTTLKHHEDLDSECWVSWNDTDQDGMSFVTVDANVEDTDPSYVKYTDTAPSSDDVPQKPVIPLAPPVPMQYQQRRKPTLPPRPRPKLPIEVSHVSHVRLVEEPEATLAPDGRLQRAKSDPSPSRPKSSRRASSVPPTHSKTATHVDRQPENTACWAWCGHCCPWYSPKGNE